MAKITMLKRLKNILKSALPFGLGLFMLGGASSASAYSVDIQSQISELKRPTQRLVLQLAKVSHNSNAETCAHASHASHASHSSHRSHCSSS